jgi:hypothetical protein
MKRKTANIDIRVEPRLVEKIDDWRARQRVPPSRTAAIVYMIEQFLKHDPRIKPVVEPYHVTQIPVGHSAYVAQRVRADW